MYPFKHACACLLALLLAFSAAAQQDSTFADNQIKFSPLRLYDPVNPGLELSYERAYARKFSAQLALGFMHDFTDVSNKEQYQGWRISFENKMFFSPPAFMETKGHTRMYLSAELVYRNVGYGKTGPFHVAQWDSSYTTDYHVSKQTYVTNGKLGLQHVWHGFVFDFCVGLGIKYKVVNWSGTGHPDARWGTWPIYATDGSGFTINVPANIQIGYQF